MLEADLTTKEYQRLGCPAELMEREWAPCRFGCPVHADVRAYIQALGEGRWQDAIDTIRRHLPLAAVCGRICHHPCEANCRRKDVDTAVAIRELKRFVAEKQGAAGSTVHKAAKQDKARVGIVGAGPAGLSAALDLAKRGYRPVIFEKFPVAGGICATAIPQYRMPRDVLQIDIDWICAHGVEIRTGVEIGRDKTIGDLLKEGFAAVLIAAGLAKSRMLPLPGAEHERVYPVLEFLQSASFGKPVPIGQDVLVIGGGNVAVDAARTAVRLGAGRVRMMCLEDRQEMPAWEWEQREALEEGITFIHRRGPVEIHVRNGQITGLKARRCTRVFDENKRFDPQYDDRDTMDLECDTVILAIGQMADMGFVQGSALTADERGRLAYNVATMQTSLPNVFACGEIVTAPGSAVEACASGRRAAREIDLYLSGKPVQVDDALPPHIGEIGGKPKEKVLPVPRAEVPTERPEKRKANWVPIDHNLAQVVVLKESRRCLSCGAGAEVLVDKCAACQTCVRVCPFEVPKVEKVARIDPALCQACGICIAECPAGAIVSRSRQVDDLVRRTAEILGAVGGTGVPPVSAAEHSRAGRGALKVVAYIAGQNASAEEWQGQTVQIPGVAEVYLTSVAGLRVIDLLKAFENGADKVLVVACRDGMDRYPGVNRRVRARVEQARTLLRETGWNPDRLRLHELA